MNTTLPPGAAERAPMATAERKARALQRLEASRTQLIQRLYPPPNDGGQRPDHGGAHLVSLLAGRLRRDGWAQGSWRTARALARRWWTRQPWHVSAELVASTLAQEARPLLRRHPWACLAASAALGAALVLARPWAVRAVRQRTQVWPQHLGGMLWQQLAQAPVQLALAGALSAWLSERTRRPAGPAHPSAAETAAPLT